MEVTTAQIAGVLGVSRQMAYEYKRQGMPTEKNGRHNVKRCVEWHLQHTTHAVKPGPVLEKEQGSAPDKDWRLEMQRLKLREQQATTEAAEYRAKIKRGDLVSRQAASALHGRILWNLFHTLDMAPLSFLHLLTTDKSVVIRVDGIIRNNVRRAFERALNDARIGRENTRILESCENIIQLCTACIEIAQIEQRNPEDWEAVLRFVQDVQRLFFDMPTLQDAGLQLRPEGDEAQ